MEKLRRRIFFWILVIAFFLTAPAVILRARGYRFDFSRGVFVYSGAITLKTNPENVNVILNGELNETGKNDRINSAIQLSGLLPGEYSIEVAYPGFRSWKKKAQVRSGVSSEFWNVLLVRENYEKEEISRENLDFFFTSPRNNLLASSLNNENGLEIRIIDINNQEEKNRFLMPGKKLSPPENKENIEWSPNKNSYLSVPVLKQGEDGNIQDYYILNLSEKTSFSLGDFLGISDLKDVRWDPDKENYLFFLSEKKLYRANILDKNDLTLISEEASAFDISKTDIYFCRESNHITYRQALSGNATKEQVTFDFPKDLEGQVSKMIVYDKERIAFWDENENFFVYNRGENGTYFKKLGRGIKGTHFSDDGKKLLFWTGNEISVYFLRDWNVQPIRRENDLINVARYLEEIKNIQWFSDYEHVLFSVGPYIKVIELDPRDHKNCLDIITTGSQNPFFIANASLEKIFLVDEGENKKNNLFSIDFPEKNTFLGF